MTTMSNQDGSSFWVDGHRMTTNFGPSGSGASNAGGGGGSLNLGALGGMTSSSSSGNPASRIIAPGPNVQSQAEQERYDPWSRYRGQAGDMLAGGMNPNNDPSNFYRTKLEEMASGQFSPDDPSYLWRLQQGQQAAERSLATRGLLGSGNAAIELQQYGQGAASTEYAAQFSRLLEGLSGVTQQYDTQQRRLMELAGVGADPTAGGSLNVAQQNAQTNAQGVNDQWSLGNARMANDMAMAQLQSRTSTANARTSASSGGSSLAANLQAAQQAYEQRMNNQGQDQIMSDSFFYRPNGILGSYY